MDQQIQCCDCSTLFDFSEGEQSFYQSKGLTPPRRCPSCRAAKKARAGGGQQRDMQRPHSRSAQRRMNIQQGYDVNQGMGA